MTTADLFCEQARKHLDLKNVNTKKIKKVLIIEDEADLREIIEYELNYHSIMTLSAGHGGEALELLKRNEVNLIISDVNMPVCNGFQFLEKLRQTSLTPLILMTSDAEVTYEEAYRKGANAFLQKPFRVDSLVGLVNSFILVENHEIEQRLDKISREFDINLIAEDWPSPLAGKATNISRGDMFVNCRPPRHVINKKVAFQIQDHTTDTRLTGQGIIVWTREQGNSINPQGCCIKFLKLTDSSQQSLDELLKLSAAGNKKPF